MRFGPLDGNAVRRLQVANAFPGRKASRPVYKHGRPTKHLVSTEPVQVLCHTRRQESPAQPALSTPIRAALDLASVLQITDVRRVLTEKLVLSPTRTPRVVKILWSGS